MPSRCPPLPALLAAALLLGTGLAPAPGHAQDTVRVSMPLRLASPFDRVQVPLTVDMGPGGTALGSIQGTLRVDTAVVTPVSATAGTFQGSLELNLDSLSAGVIRFAGANADSLLNRGVLTVLELTVDVGGGSGGERAALDLTVDEVASAGDLMVLTGVTVVEDGAFVVDTGPIESAWRFDTPGVPDSGTLPVTLWLHHGESQAVPGAASGLLRFRQEILAVDSVTPGGAGGTLETNLAPQADSGFVRWAFVAPDPPPADSFPLAVFHIRGVGAQGDTARIGLEVEELVNELNFASLLPLYVQPQAPVFLVGAAGIWGDADFGFQDDPATAVAALDALICLSFIVGRDVSQFDPTACDVAPDVDVDGDTTEETFDGTVTALDALAILSHVVGRTLPPTFRPGEVR